MTEEKPNRQEHARRVGREQKSFVEDKAVQDTVVESWICIDCGVNTAPGFSSGPEVRVALALGQVVSQRGDDRSEVYHVKAELWKAAGMRPWNGCLCVGCLEKRIGRQLRPKDFARHDAKAWADYPCTDRLLDRRGLRQITVMTAEGEKEVILDKRDADKFAAIHAPGELPYMGNPT
jgi:hypothetical protein